MSFSDDRPIIGRRPSPRLKAVPALPTPNDLRRLGQGLLLTGLGLSALSMGASAFVLPGAAPSLLTAAEFVQSPWFVAVGAMLFPLAACFYVAGRSAIR